MAAEEQKEGADRLARLKERLDDLSRMLDQFQEARRAGRRTRVGIVIVIVLVMLGYGLVIYRSVAPFDRAKWDKFRTEMYSRMMELGDETKVNLMAMARRVAPAYRAEIQRQLRQEWPKIRGPVLAQLRASLSNVAAAYGEEFQRQLGQRWPDLQQALAQQADLFVNNVQDSVRARIAERLPQIAERQEKRVVAAFPVLADPTKRDLVMDNLEKALQGAVLDVLGHRVKDAEEVLRRVHERILAFLPESRREGFRQRMARVWEQFLLFDLGGVKEIQP